MNEKIVGMTMRRQKLKKIIVNSGKTIKKLQNLSSKEVSGECCTDYVRLISFFQLSSFRNEYSEM